MIICPELDMLIAKCPACNLGLPQIFLPDSDDIDDENEFSGAMIPGRSERRFDKEKRFGKLQIDYLVIDCSIDRGHTGNSH